MSKTKKKLTGVEIEVTGGCPPTGWHVFGCLVAVFGSVLLAYYLIAGVIIWFNTTNEQIAKLMNQSTSFRYELDNDYDFLVKHRERIDAQDERIKRLEESCFHDKTKH